MEMSEAVPQPPPGLSMRELLASCAAAAAVSTPPQEESEDAERTTGDAEQRDAA
ncbi:hypothetical protein [Streptomyces sp. NPDC050738]|uniref:hypothetical protein n=1 Tax=Streptomyces sp. NPDC050738 TaxID=3154744 RepID=UPI00342EF6D9